jgi:hypothetical protein
MKIFITLWNDFRQGRRYTWSWRRRNRSNKIDDQDKENNNYYNNAIDLIMCALKFD